MRTPKPITVGLEPFRRFAARNAEHPLIRAVRDHGGNILDAGGPTRIEHERIADFMRYAPRIAGDEAIGLRLASAVEPTDLDILHYIARASSTLRSSLEKCAAQLTLLHDSVRLGLTPEPEERTRVHYEMPPDLHMPPALADLVVGLTVKLGLRLSGKQLPPLEVHFRHAPPADLGPYVSFFGAACHFGSDYDGFVVSNRALEAPIPSADPRLCELLEAHARQMTERLATSTAFADRVRHLVVQELSGGNPSIDHIAGRLQMSERTVRRRLDDEKTTYQALLGELRETLAKRYLAEGLPVEEVSFLLGYSTASAFRRAFKRWTGVAPATYRGQPVALGKTRIGPHPGSRNETPSPDRISTP